MALSPDTKRRLRASKLRLAEARQARADAIASAFKAGAEIPDIARELGLDAFEVRDVLVEAGAVKTLKPKESAARS